MRRRYLVTLPMLILALGFLSACRPADTGPSGAGEQARITLPEPRRDSGVSVEEALWKRRSIRDYTGEALTLQEVSQLLWAVQGITDTTGKRTAPSAGAL